MGPFYYMGPCVSSLYIRIPFILADICMTYSHGARAPRTPPAPRWSGPGAGAPLPSWIGCGRPREGGERGGGGDTGPGAGRIVSPGWRGWPCLVWLVLVLAPVWSLAAGSWLLVPVRPAGPVSSPGLEAGRRSGFGGPLQDIAAGGSARRSWPGPGWIWERLGPA